MFIGLNIWLRSYTNHGQKLELPDYVNMSLEEASQDAEDKTFQLIVNDSIHIVGQPGGIITRQNPVKGSKVKEDRKVYVTITKYGADQIKVGNLGVIYGQDYNSKKRELSYLEIESKIKGRKYDPGESDHILEVWYKGKPIITSNVEKKSVSIAKGDTLSFVISQKAGGETVVPDLMCNTLAAVKFILESSNLKLGEVVEVGEITDLSSAYIIEQYPPTSETNLIPMGRSFNVKVSQEKPNNCQ